MSSIQIFQGEARKITVSVTDPAGEPLDLGSAELAFLVRGDSNVIVKNHLSGITVDGPGEFSIALEDTDTSIIPRVYRYEIRISLGDDITTVSAGTFTVHNSLFVD